MAKKEARSVTIAREIHAHLKRFEADPVINAERFFDSFKTGKRESAGHSYYNANASASGGRVHVRYISYQHTTSFTIERAQAYLDWLNAGNVGTHYEMERSAKTDQAQK